MTTPIPKELLDLTPELLAAIFSYSSRTDLITLSLVSSRCRELAAEHLYRRFLFVFPDDDDDLSDSTIDALAGGLDTFATSEYDYAKYLREIVLETVNGGDKAERAYRLYHYNDSCGKFMNTLFLLVLRKAKALETFRWDIRVELSRQVFKALHEIPNLRHLHLRMQHGSSLYENPPALSAPIFLSAGTSIILPPTGHAPIPSSTPISILPPLMQHQIYTGGVNHYVVGAVTASKPHKKASKATTAQKPPPTFSGFKNLQSLAVLDMGTLDYGSEIKECLQNSCVTLKSLKLSFSDGLASRSKKPPPEPHSDSESDLEDEFGQIIPPGGPPPNFGGASDPNIAIKTMKAQLEKKKQEAFLAKLFGVEKHAAKPSPVAPEKPPPPKAIKDLHKAFIRGLAPLGKLLKSTDDDAGKKAHDLIVRAAAKYLETAEGKAPTKVSSGASFGSPASSTVKVTPLSSIIGADAAEDSGPGLFDEPTRKKPSKNDPDTADPDDIDVEQPEEVELSIDTDLAAGESDDISAVDTPAREAALIASAEQLSLEAEETEGDSKLSVESGERDYIRQTRGIPLEALEISLIPIKASVIMRAIDVNCLRKLTLLNVGSQTPLWRMLSKDYDVSSLKLKTIQTDHVSIELLAFLNRLEAIEELLLLECKEKRRVESVTAKTNVAIEQIRKAVLKKHASSLKVLMIRNEASVDWDLNVETSLLLCQHAKGLEELTASIGAATMHTFLQFLSGLTSLRALHINQFRGVDPSPGMPPEYRRFAIDSISHMPEIKLQYLAVEDNVDYLVRHLPAKKSAASEQKSKARSKDKKKSTLYQQLADMESNDNSWMEGLNLVPTLGMLIEGYDDTEDDEDFELGGKKGLKIEQVVGMRFCDITGVRIFEKDALLGRL